MCLPYAELRTNVIFCSFLFVTQPSFSDILFDAVPELRNVPFADDIIRETRLLPCIDGTENAYNPGLERYGTGTFLMVIRDDRRNYRYNRLSLILLNNDFSAVSSSVIIKTPEFVRPQDPRLFYLNGQLYILYSKKNTHPGEFLKLVQAKLSPDGSLTECQVLEYEKKSHEKNWVPFVTDYKKKQRLYYVSKFSPFTVLETDEEKVSISKCIVEHPIDYDWAKKWGELRGGTPAVRLDNGNYLAFFHSSFSKKKEHVCDGYWVYVFGAIVFSGSYPFRPLMISPYPILFNGCYKAAISPLTWFWKQIGCTKTFILFPTGLVAGQGRDHNLLYVTCGENDSSARLIVFDREKLLASLVPIG